MKIISMWQYDHDKQVTPFNDGTLIAEQDAEISIDQLVQECIRDGSASINQLQGQFDESDNLDEDLPDTYPGDVLDAYIDTNEIQEKQVIFKDPLKSSVADEARSLSESNEAKRNELSDDDRSESAK